MGPEIGGVALSCGKKAEAVRGKTEAEGVPQQRKLVVTVSKGLGLGAGGEGCRLPGARVGQDVGGTTLLLLGGHRVSAITRHVLWRGGGMSGPTNCIHGRRDSQALGCQATTGCCWLIVHSIVNIR